MIYWGWIFVAISVLELIIIFIFISNDYSKERLFLHWQWKAEEKIWKRIKKLEDDVRRG